jgi:hypothetical protein
LRLLDIVLDNHVLVLSRFILDEVERVLLYSPDSGAVPNHGWRGGPLYRQSGRCRSTRRTTGHSQADYPVRSGRRSRPLHSGADGAVDILCTRNTRHFSSPAAQAFCDEHSIRVMTDLDILRELFRGGGSGG